MALFPLAAALVSAVFAGLVLRRWADRRRPHLVAWGIALGMFAIASLAAAGGIAFGWTPLWFRIYFLFGAIVNVPVLGLGTIYLLAARRPAHVSAVIVGVACLVAAGIILGADLERPGLAVTGIPAGADVLSDRVRNVARVYSYAGFAVVVGGALWSAWRLGASRAAPRTRLIGANLLIALGTSVNALAGAFARKGAGSMFAIGLFVGVTIMFIGFLRTVRPAPS